MILKEMACSVRKRFLLWSKAVCPALCLWQACVSVVLEKKFVTLKLTSKHNVIVKAHRFSFHDFRTFSYSFMYIMDKSAYINIYMCVYVYRQQIDR